MATILLLIIYFAFISLCLPDSMLGAGDDYLNAAYGQSPFTLNLTIETGSGDIILEGSRSSSRRSLPDRI